MINTEEKTEEKTEKLLQTGPDRRKNSWRNMDWKTVIVSAIVLGLLVYTIAFMWNTVLLTFLLTFIFYALLKFIRKWLARVPRLARIPDAVILILCYVLGLTLVGMCGVAFTGVLVTQATEIARSFINFDFRNIRDALDPRVAEYIMDLDINSYLDQVGLAILNALPGVGKFSFNLVMAIALSFLLLLEKRKIALFGEVMEKSRIADVYRYVYGFGINFCRTFGKVMKVQVTIAFFNGILSIIMLAILGFPNIWGLGIMIFLLGLVPVAGVIISLVPLTIIAFNIGGFTKVIQVLVMVAIIHILEAYVLNPKLMSSRTDLPVCFIFTILLVAEQWLGAWGLLIGIPLFIFLMTIFEIRYEEAMHSRKKDGRWLPKARER